MAAYRASGYFEPALLADYLSRLGNAAAAKRLGYLMELAGVTHVDERLVGRLQEMVTSGYALLDPDAGARGPFVARWNLRANVDLA